MSGRPSTELQQAMDAVKHGGKTPYAAAKDAGIALSTMYRSALYKAWKAEQEEQERKRPKHASK